MIIDKRFYSRYNCCNRYNFCSPCSYYSFDNHYNLSSYDNYYNHHLYTGWQHWGQVLGNPLYLSPLYNTDGHIEVEHNRFVAWHLGFSGSPCSRLHYRVLASWQKSYGSYYPIPGGI